ncbi:MAG: NAD(P)H-dependent oxidoreductase [Candidatus Tectomicrobia bacterium]|uniref:NAD(P)H-dependent oxidoreductase n=1 Tax=Tectimicrobiota bacterium TaxID=2528274 RepID=A0A932HXA6_UNCTE|nr:NAD(P)H-dependent oxidoreductase [Candidatus Tectomicrobia bacterium]
MPYTPQILAFAGSTRRESFNKNVLRIAAEGAREAGAEVTFLDFKELPLPLYDGDLEAEGGIPPNALRLKALMKGHQGFLIASPEYNSSITAVLKNAIDWASRPMEGEKPLECFAGKAAVLMSASPGALGGLRSLSHVRSILMNIQTMVLPQQVAVPRAHEALTEEGRLKDAKQEASIKGLGKTLADMLAKLA